MTSDTPFKLSKYQSAVLTEMGISVWQKKSDSDQTADNTTQNAVAMGDIPAVQEKPTELPAAIAQFKNKAAEDKTPQSEPVMAIPDAVLVSLNDESINRNLIRDVLLTLNLDEHRQHKAFGKPITQFSEYAFAWQMSDNLTLHDNILSTPQVLDAEAKRKLWQLLASYEH